jgi:hypothetical protein
MSTTLAPPGAERVARSIRAGGPIGSTTTEEVYP